MKHLKSLKELKSLPGKWYVGTASPGRQLHFPGYPHVKSFSNIRVADYTRDYVASEAVTKRIIIELCAWFYTGVIQRERKRIDAIFSWVYGSVPPYKERQISSINLIFKDILRETGCTFNQMADEIRDYITPGCIFWREQGGKRVIVDSGRMLEAWKALRDNRPFGDVEKILYF